jgi:hypothetical protein
MGYGGVAPFAVLVSHPEFVIAFPCIMAAIGFLAGLVGGRFRVAPWFATAVMVLAYLALLGVAGSWYAACRDCPEGDSTRGAFFAVAVIFGLWATLGLVAVVWLGRLASLAYESLMWWRRT